MDAERHLRAATTLAVVEALALAALVIGRHGTGRLLLVAAVVAKVPFCVLARRHHAGGWFALVFWEASALLLALVAPRVEAAVRVTVGVVAAAVLVLLVRGAAVFPPPRLPERWSQ